MCDCDKKIQLSLLCPMTCTKSVIVKLSQPIHVLQRLFPNQEAHKFYFNGQALHESNSFGFYEVKNEDAIIAIVKNDHQDVNFNKKSKRSLSKNEGSDEHIDFSGDVSVCKEFLRLRDVKLDFLLRKPHVFRKICKIMDGIDDQAEQNKVKLHDIKTNYEKPNSISSKPLPSFW